MSSKTLKFDKIGAYLNRVPASMAGIEAKVGYHEGAAYEDGTPVAYVATIMENGAPAQGIPARPTMGPTLRTNKKHYVDQMAAGAKHVLAGRIDGEKVIEAIGMECAGDIKKAISTLTSPELNPATVKARMRRYANKGKGSATTDKPLVDSGLMLDTCTSEVGKK